MEKAFYKIGGIYYSRSHFIVGDRSITLIEVDKMNDYDLLENDGLKISENRDKQVASAACFLHDILNKVHMFILLSFVEML